MTGNDWVTVNMAVISCTPLDRVTTPLGLDHKKRLARKAANSLTGTREVSMGVHCKPN